MLSACYCRKMQLISSPIRQRRPRPSCKVWRIVDHSRGRGCDDQQLVRLSARERFVIPNCPSRGAGCLWQRPLRGLPPVRGADAYPNVTSPRPQLAACDSRVSGRMSADVAIPIHRMRTISLVDRPRPSRSTPPLGLDCPPFSNAGRTNPLALAHPVTTSRLHALSSRAASFTLAMTLLDRPAAFLAYIANRSKASAWRSRHPARSGSTSPTASPLVSAASTHPPVRSAALLRATTGHMV